MCYLLAPTDREISCYGHHAAFVTLGNRLPIEQVYYIRGPALQSSIHYDKRYRLQPTDLIGLVSVTSGKFEEFAFSGNTIAKKITSKQT